MAIYDYDGTTNHEIGKLYDYDGTTNYQIGKVYDNNGTADSLIYNAEEIILDASQGFVANDWNLVANPGVYVVGNVSKNGGKYTHGKGYLQIEPNSGVILWCDNELFFAYDGVAIDFSQYTKISFLVSWHHYNAVKDVWAGIKNGLYGDWVLKFNPTYNGLYEFDISNINITGLVAIAAEYYGGITISKIILE